MIMKTRKTRKKVKTKTKIKIKKPFIVTSIRKRIIKETNDIRLIRNVILTVIMNIKSFILSLSSINGRSYLIRTTTKLTIAIL
jgi:hypothetical protein